MGMADGRSSSFAEFHFTEQSGGQRDAIFLRGKPGECPRGATKGNTRARRRGGERACVAENLRGDGAPEGSDERVCARGYRYRRFPKGSDGSAGRRSFA